MQLLLSLNDAKEQGWVTEVKFSMITRSYCIKYWVCIPTIYNFVKHDFVNFIVDFLGLATTCEHN